MTEKPPKKEQASMKRYAWTKMNSIIEGVSYAVGVISTIAARAS
jgi:hypothetical protein